MKRIELRGVIVPGNYDGDWASAYIERGIFTPESRIRKALAEANDDVELYINSQGGSVFAGNEISNALKSFEATGHKVDVTVGALAASMAAVIVAGCKPENVKLHQNTQIMFHGAQVVTEGGAGSHEDSAALLTSMNRQVIDRLTAKNPDMGEEIKGWFEEGRAGWITAQKAVEMGLASSVIGAKADAVTKVSKEAAKAMLDNGGIDIAAFDFEAPKAEAGDTEHEEVNRDIPMIALSDYETLKARFSGMQSAKDKEIEALKNEFSEKLTALRSEKAVCEKTINDLTAQTEMLKADIDKAKAELISAKGETEKAMTDLAREGELRKQAEARHAALVGGVLLQDGEADNLTWPEVSQRLGYAEAKKRYPELWQKCNETTKTKGKTK